MHNDIHAQVASIRYSAKTEAPKGLPTVQLGDLLVGNWGSPHPFTFEGGIVLEACSATRSQECSLVREDEEQPSSCGRYTVVKPVFLLTERNIHSLLESASAVDVLIVPFPVLEALRQNPARVAPVVHERAATCILVDRISKVCSATKFGR